jgi:hypothetical protein
VAGWLVEKLDNLTGGELIRQVIGLSFGWLVGWH